MNLAEGAVRQAQQRATTRLGAAPRRVGMRLPGSRVEPVQDGRKKMEQGCLAALVGTLNHYQIAQGFGASVQILEPSEGPHPNTFDVHRPYLSPEVTDRTPVRACGR